MALDLTKYGITGSTVIAHNPSYEELYKAEINPALDPIPIFFFELKSLKYH